MSTIEILHEDGDYSTDGTVVIDKQDNVWLTFSKPRYDIVGWLWWFLSSGKKAWLNLTTADGKKVRVRAVRLARKYVRIG